MNWEVSNIGWEIFWLVLSQTWELSFPEVDMVFEFEISSWVSGKVVISEFYSELNGISLISSNFLLSILLCIFGVFTGLIVFGFDSLFKKLWLITFIGLAPIIVFFEGEVFLLFSKSPFTSSKAFFSISNPIIWQILSSSLKSSTKSFLPQRLQQ